MRPHKLKEGSFYQSVFIDEVQDFTEQQIYLMAEQTRPEYQAITVVGDIAQKLHHGSQIDIPACFQLILRVSPQTCGNLTLLDWLGLARVFVLSFRTVRPAKFPVDYFSNLLKKAAVRFAVQN